jgi:hypothetical protein
MNSDILSSIPQNILQAAQEIQLWMEMNGHKDWELFGIADRRIIDKWRKVGRDSLSCSPQPINWMQIEKAIAGSFN